MPLGSARFPGLAEAFGVGWSATMVDVEEDRENVFARGARCVSLSFLVSFQDMLRVCATCRASQLLVERLRVRAE
jgi:hypothetical protein